MPTPDIDLCNHDQKAQGRCCGTRGYKRKGEREEYLCRLYSVSMLQYSAVISQYLTLQNAKVKPTCFFKENVIIV